MKLTWHGHSCFTLETANGTFVLDPYQEGSVPGYAPLALAADAVLCSHEHRDHNGRDRVALSGKAPAVAVEEIHTFHDPEQGKLRGTDIIRIFSAEGLKAAHLGDLGCELEQAQKEKLKGLDLIMVPVGGFYTIDARQAKDLMDQLQPRVVVPMHYRGEGFGYDVIAPLEDYLALCDDVVRYDSDTLELTKDTPAQTAVLSYKG